MGKDSSAEVARLRQEYLSDADDEISLIELWMIFVRRWKVAAVIFSLFLVIGVVIALSSPLKYQYSTTVEIGSFETKAGARAFLEPLKMVQTNLENNYIPNIVENMKATHWASPQSVDVSVVGKHVVIKSLGRVLDSAEIKQMHLSAIDKVIEDHHVFAENRMKLLEQEYRQKSEQFRLAKELTEALDSRQSDLLSSSLTLQTKLNKIHEYITEVNKNRFSSDVEENNILKALMISRKLEAHEARLLAIENRLYVSTPQELVNIKKMLVDNYENSLEIQLSLGAVTAQMVTQLPTQLIALAVRAKNPSGIGWLATVVLSMLIGVFVSVLVVFICEFISKANAAVRNANGT
ncbi:MAG: Wzz/FepE/Etk N-terminal domain-containing protein [Gammaproteobacteria bacterium]|nr:Wzz/FepE/Etk N-terminal domain-containing protein [Gammaproteobacteria bacterium]